MIIIKLIGGIGNQMFQYAYGLQLAYEYQDQICFDTSFYPTNSPLALYTLSVPQYPQWTEVGIPLFERVYVKLLEKTFHIIQKLIRIFGRTDRTGNILYHIFAKQGMMFNFDPYFYKVGHCNKKNKYVYGYFQGAMYFPDCKDILQKCFDVAVPLGTRAQNIEKQIEKENAVAVHVRLGDYTSAVNTDLNVCNEIYYKRAISYVCQVVDQPVFYVFTNDPEGVMERFTFPKGTILVQGTKDYEDFALMKKCKHFVSSNSTFSWWASYLSENPQKVVTVPNRWRHSEQDAPAIYREDMVKISID